jgi:hypothetical protein
VLLLQVHVLVDGEHAPSRVEPFACEEILEGNDDEGIEYMLGYNRVRL